MNTRLRLLPRQPLEYLPRITIVLFVLGAGSRDWEVVCAGPGRGVGDVVVTGHVLCDDGDIVLASFGKDEGGGETGDAGTVEISKGFN